jgi:RimJ/RimL family protein N-acetyltransferase
LLATRREESWVDDLALMELRVAALFRHDEAGRIVTNNEPEPDPGRAPRLFLGRTAAGNVWRFRDDLPDETVARVQPLLAAEPPLRSDDPRQPPVYFAALCDILAADGPLGEVWQGPAWQFPETIPSPVDVVIVGPGNRHLLRSHFPYAAEYLQARQPCAAVIAEGHAVSVCYSSRLTPHAAEAGVDTVETFRGRGYAGRVVAAWAIAVRAGGRIPFYSTDWDNVASHAVARKLGLILYGVDLSLD